METKKIIFDGEEVEFVVSIDEECIERNEESFLEDTLILNDVVDIISGNSEVNK